MKIATINDRTKYLGESSYGAYLERISEVVSNSGADLVVGPELAMADLKGVLSLEQFNFFVNSLKSSVSANQVVVPGTALVYDEGKGTLRNRAPIICGDGNIYVFDKKSAVEEVRIAKKLGLEYIRGKSSEGFFEFQGKVYSLEICRDHGHAKLKQASNIKSDLGLVLASNGNFYPTKSVVKDGGLAVVVDGGKENGSDVFRNDSGDFNVINPLELNEAYNLWSV
jgi:predicted amidohydrolase